MIHDKERLSALDRTFSVFTTVRRHEGLSILLFSCYGFLLLTSYHVLKTIRETLLLTSFSPQTRSYAVAVIAIIMVFLVPLYGLVFRHTRKVNLVRWLSAFIAANIGILYLMGRSGQEIGFIYFVFVGIVGVVAVAQFWAFALDCYNIKSGQRVFPVIMIGAAGGGLAGAQLTKLLTGSGMVAPLEMMPIAAVIMLTTIFIASAASRSVPVDSRCVTAMLNEPREQVDTLRQALGGFALVIRDRYLLLLAMMVVLQNWINTTGETILAYFVSRHAQSVAGGDPVRTGELIAAFYGDYFFWVTLIGFLVQAFLVSRIYRRIGLSGALLLLPLIAVVGYGLMAFVPIFSIIRIVKIFENSADYSLMNTTRQALFLPTSRSAKYEGKMAIDTFFWRFGDLLQAGVVYAGLNWLHLGVPHFALLNLLLALVWLVLAVLIGKEYRRLVRENPMNNPPELREPLPDIFVAPGTAVQHTLAADAFVDTDPGEVISLHVRLSNGAPLPNWLRFHSSSRTFYGNVPHSISNRTEIEVVATDFEGLTANGTFFFVHDSRDVSVMES